MENLVPKNVYLNLPRLSKNRIKVAFDRRLCSARSCIESFRPDRTNDNRSVTDRARASNPLNVFEFNKSTISIDMIHTNIYFMCLKKLKQRDVRCFMFCIYFVTE